MRSLWDCSAAGTCRPKLPLQIPPPAIYARVSDGAGSHRPLLILASLVRAFRIEFAEQRTVGPIGVVGTQPDSPPSFLPRLRGKPGRLALSTGKKLRCDYSRRGLSALLGLYVRWLLTSRRAMARST